MRHLQTGALLASVLGTGLMAGLFAAFAYAVMPGLGRSSDRTLVDAMQGINKAIVNPVFMLPFMGSIPLLGLAVVLAWRGQGREALPWLIAALVLYVVAFGVTVAGNIPLNDQLDRAGDPDRIKDLAAVRADFEDKWVAWNVVRAVLHTVAFGLAAYALIVYGAHRLADGAEASRGPAPASVVQGVAGWQQPQQPVGPGPGWQPQPPQGAPQAQPGPRWEYRAAPFPGARPGAVSQT
ncbi:anthrone oxygenase family protein [Streptomyces phytophilus]|uniref:anthrone oxygenase family protein n=1 Tax=Streptomyces phytophilus TaxID=722715 RepID=UPI0015EFF68C|nr:anthrone oxygenase family protein [Streptomyces phytophilus]